jgi:hypothetical protein
MMTELKGTEKQVRWAEEIREQKLAELDALMDEALKAMPEEKTLIEEQMASYRARLLKIEYASEWIDDRGYSVEDIIEVALPRLGI